MSIPYAPHVLLALGLLGQEPIRPEPITSDNCGVLLATRAGLTTHDAEEVIRQLRMHSVIQDETFLRYLYALAYAESRFRTGRRSEKGAVGIMQVTPQAAEHIHNLTSRSLRYDKYYHLSVMIRRAVGLHPPNLKDTLRRLSQLTTNVNIGSAYLSLALEESGGDWIGALTMYNSGYYGLTRLRRGDTVPLETAQYVVKVVHLFNTCGIN